MKNIISTILVTIIIILSSKNVLSQNDIVTKPSVIHIVRSSSVLGSGCDITLSLRNQSSFKLNIGSLVNYTIFSEGEVLIDLEQYCPPSRYSNGHTRTEQVVLNIKGGNDYYVIYDGVIFKATEKAEANEFINEASNTIKREENIDNPINKIMVKSPPKVEGKGQGTCFLISENGYFITNNHVVENANEVIIKGIDNDFSTKYQVTVIATDKSNDLALLKINNKNLKFNTPPYSIRSYGVEQGEKVFVLGYPLTNALGNEIKLTDGILSAKSGVMGDISKFQVSSAVQPGNSGCPLFDEQGNVIGIINSKSTIADAASYAIKASYLESFLKSVDSFKYPILVNTIKAKPLPAKVIELKKFIFIVETN